MVDLDALQQKLEWKETTGVSLCTDSWDISAISTRPRQGQGHQLRKTVSESAQKEELPLKKN